MGLLPLTFSTWSWQPLMTIQSSVSWQCTDANAAVSSMPSRSCLMTKLENRILIDTIKPCRAKQQQTCRWQCQRWSVPPGWMSTVELLHITMDRRYCILQGSRAATMNNSPSELPADCLCMHCGKVSISGLEYGLPAHKGLVYATVCTQDCCVKQHMHGCFSKRSHAQMLVMGMCMQYC